MVVNNVNGTPPQTPAAPTAGHTAGQKVHGGGGHHGGAAHHALQQVNKKQGGTANQIRKKSQFAQGPYGQPPHLAGTVVSVDAAAGTVVVQPNDPQTAQVTVTTDGDTKIKVNAKEAALGDVKAGMDITVLPPNGTATEIRAYTMVAALFFGGLARFMAGRG